MRTDLKSGAWIEHRPIQDLKGKDKDAVDRVIRMSLPMTAEGELDTSHGLSIGMEMQEKRRNALIARVVTGWSFTRDDGSPLPVPYHEADLIVHEDSIGDYPIDDAAELDELLAPYLVKVARKPNPKAQAAATITNSNGSSRASAAPPSPTA